MVKIYEGQGLIYTLVEEGLVMFGVKFCISFQRNAAKSCKPFFATKEHVTTLYFLQNNDKNIKVCFAVSLFYILKCHTLLSLQNLKLRAVICHKTYVDRPESSSLN